MLLTPLGELLHDDLERAAVGAGKRELVAVDLRQTLRQQPFARVES